MKKIISISLVLVILISMFSIVSSAETLSVSNSELDSLFLDGECPGELDYVYYAPETKQGTKYPLVVWLHGAKSGDKPRAQLEWYRFSNWASEEYQARFNNAGGAFLLAVRSSKDITHNWYETGCSTLKKTIDYFISLYSDKIDTSRIYISGYSTGGSMVWHMVTKYPEFFAAAMPIASLYNPTSSEMDKLSDTSIWVFSCEKDFYVSAATNSAKVNFEYLKDITNRPYGVRHTSFSQAVFADNTKKNAVDKEHFIWCAVTNDMFMDTGEQYYYSTTVDAMGNKISFSSPNGVISWLSSQTNEEESKNTISFFTRLINFMKNLMNRFLALFGI